MSNVPTVMSIYQAFGRRDVPAVLDKLDDAILWEASVPVPEVPWLQTRRGRAEVVGFFQALASLTITRFEPHTIFDGGDKVFVLISFEASVDGKLYSFPNNGHLWQFDAAGKVVRYDHVTDTAQMIRLAKGS